jgi:hypothetical protein
MFHHAVLMADGLTRNAATYDRRGPTQGPGSPCSTQATIAIDDGLSTVPPSAQSGDVQSAG